MTLVETRALGELVQVELRSAWISEAGDFTPWLAQDKNLKLLGDAIGLDLQLEAQEKNVGPFRADLLCKDVTNGNWVLVENQLESTDHTHLGQLLTYAAGLKAVTIVWIASRFTEEHRAAVDWLNEITGEHISFFGLEVELWRIGDSPVAPKLNIVCKPNDWSKRRQTPGDITDTQQLYLEYWHGLKECLDLKKSTVRMKKPQPQMWMNFPLGRSEFYLNAVISKQKQSGAVQLVISGPDHVAYMKQLQQMPIEAELGEVEWRELKEGKESHVRRRFEKWDPCDRKDWARQHEKLRLELEAFRRCFAPKVKELEVTSEMDVTS